MATKIALVGIGKIAVDQHVPALKASADWDLAATVSRSGRVDGIEAFTDMAAMLEARPDIPVVSLALPPAPRFAYAEACLKAGRHVMLEKPPGMTLAEIHMLEVMAAERNLSLYATWHSRMATGVQPARDWLADKVIRRVHITWREDVRKWHPGQDWVFEPGGMGVFDPGINALSILTEILPAPVRVIKARLETPENRQTPIGAQITFSDNVTMDLDWRQEGPQTWTIEAETDGGTLTLTDGGANMSIDGQAQVTDGDREYPRLYARMADLVKTGARDMDLTPMIHVSDAMMLGERVVVEPFHF
ncbi:Gfo/Idh/MocA family protein [Oceaniglobus indicus]|uniref:Gfo/Idh/MocA family protein n=1 Tax=Oceaniglobus indicus TaxID=2047749 RepID=UPI000C1A08BE|nr:Gfo/Idh/MocA family oxidoreductase [Oceaniglobus indicus]